MFDLAFSIRSSSSAHCGPRTWKAGARFSKLVGWNKSITWRPRYGMTMTEPEESHVSYALVN